MIHPGCNFRKVASGRKAQVSSVTKTHAVMYWPDKDENTTVRPQHPGTKGHRSHRWPFVVPGQMGNLEP